MNYSTYAALTNYDTVAAALAAKPTDGQAWLLNETKIFQDGRMSKSGPNSVKKSAQTQLAKTLSNTIGRNKISANPGGTKANKVAGYANTSPGGGSYVNREIVANNKTASIRHKVSWYVTDSSQATGYRRVFGILEDPTTTSPYRDDDNQVRI